MKEKITALLKDKGTWLRIGICVLLSVLYGVWKAPLLLHFIDGITISGFLMLGLALIHEYWKNGTFSFWSWNRNKSSFSSYHEKNVQKREETPNPSALAAAVLLIPGITMSVLYSILH